MILGWRGYWWAISVGFGTVLSALILPIWLRVRYGKPIKIHVLIVHLASSDHTARLWEMASGETVRQYNGHHKGMEIWLIYNDYMNAHPGRH